MVFERVAKFSPGDAALIGYYLHGRNQGLRSLEILPGTIYDEDVYATEPWNLPSECFTHGEHGNQAFFFTPRQPVISSSSRRAGKASGGVRARRTAGSGTWHGQGHLTSIDSIPAGHKTTLTFKNGDGKMTDWLMQEYVLDSPSFQTLALCRVYKKHRASGRKRSSSSSSMPLEDRHLLDTSRPKRSRRVMAIPPHRPSIWPEEPSRPPPAFHDARVCANISSEPSDSAHNSTADEPATLQVDHSTLPEGDDFVSLVDVHDFNIHDFFNSFPQANNYYDDANAASMISQEAASSPRPCVDLQEQRQYIPFSLAPDVADAASLLATDFLSIQTCTGDDIDLVFSNQGMSFQQLLRL